MKRIYLFFLLFLHLFLLSCDDEKQIIHNSDNNWTLTNKGDTISIDSLFIYQIGRIDAIIGMKILFPDSIEEIEYGIELSVDSTFEEGITTIVRYRESISENDLVFVSLEYLRPNEDYYYRTYYSYQNTRVTGNVFSFKTLPLECSYIDLGLSVNWASCNIGANTPEEYGNYYAWGEIDTKDNYSWSTYKWKRNNDDLLSKYCTDGGYGLFDNKVDLEYEDDIARSIYGDNWQLPSEADWLELENNCYWEWTTINGIDGWLITSLIEGYRDKSIFLSASGIKKNDKWESVGSAAYYWSYQLNKEYPRTAQSFYIDSLGYMTKVYDRCYGLSIRPVSISSKWYDNASISLSSSEVKAVPGATFNITATVNYNNSIVQYSGVWSSDNPAVATVDENGYVVALSEGIANIHYTINSIDSQCTVYVLNSESEIEHDYVDLGLSVNWATFNVGAIVPEGFGGLYAWGETETKDNYTSSNYKYANGYVEKSQLCLADDVAHEKWGDNWRLPSNIELKELRENCTWKIATLNGVNGYVVTSKITGYTDRSIFLPQTFDTNYNNYYCKSPYWTSTISDTWEYYKAYALSFYNGITDLPCYLGCSVRPVTCSDSWLSSLSITIDGDSTMLIPSLSSSLKAIIKKGNDIIYPGKEITWSSSDTSVAIIDYYGSYDLGASVKAISPGTVVIKASIESLSAEYLITVYAESEIDHESVDLGLSVLWAKDNVGALYPDDEGFYYAWGETSTKQFYSKTTYKWWDDNNYITKYNFDEKNGTIDYKYELDLEDDVASIRWGDNWRMPTKEEFDELINNCTAKIVGYDLVLTSNVEGYRDCYISFPIGGYTGETVYGGRCYYWSSTLSNEETDINNNYSISGSFKAYCLQVNNSIKYPCYTTLMNRSYGFYVRPVRVSIK